MSRYYHLIGGVTVVLIFLFALIATGVINASNNQVYLPLVRNQTTTLRIVLVGRVKMPFQAYNGVQPSAVQVSSGHWLISVFRVGANDENDNGEWIVGWDGVSESAAPVTQLTHTTGGNGPSAVVPVPGGPLGDARGSISCGFFGQVYHFTWDGSISSSFPDLLVHRVVGDGCRA